MDSQSAGLLMFTSLLLSSATLIAVLRETHGALTLGRVIKRVRPGRPRRWLAVLGMALIAGGITIGPTEVSPGFAFSVLSTAALMLLFTSGLRDSALAENGVRAGWYVRRFKDLEEWRLTGDHLRWKLRDEWQACEVPPAERESLRAKLEQLIPDRESRFSS